MSVVKKFSTLAHGMTVPSALVVIQCLVKNRSAWLHLSFSGKCTEAKQRKKSLYFFLSSVSVAECSLNERNLEVRAKPCGPDLKSLNEILGIYRRIEFKIIIFISRIQVWHLKTVKYNSVSICYVGRAIHDFYWLKCPFPLPTVTELVWVRECIQLPGCLELILIY